ncbi:MAG: aminoglycoside phosphotransferase family protein [Chloroflexia bacterium]
MIRSLATCLAENWRCLDLARPPEPSTLRWVVVNGGISIRSKLVCLVWVDGPLPSFVVKFPRYPAYNGRLTTEYRALEQMQLYLPGRESMVPRPLLEFQMEGLTVTVETALTGKLLRSHLREHPGRHPATLRDLSEFTNWLTSTHVLSSRNATPSEFDSLVLDPFKAAQEELGLSGLETSRIRELYAQAQALSGHNSLSLVFNHNDPGTTNVLVNKRGRFAALIDWESGAWGLPVSDLVYFLARFGFETRGVGTEDPMRGFRELFFENNTASAGVLGYSLPREWLASYCQRLGVSLEWLSVLFCLTWIMHARNERNHLLGLQAEGQILHGKPAKAEITNVSSKTLQSAHFRSQLRYYLENLDLSLVARMSGGGLP